MNSRILFAVVACLTLIRSVMGQDAVQLDETCTVTVGNQTAIVRPDGTFFVRNISVLVPFRQRTLFEGIPLLYRVRATCIRGGVAITGQSEFFELTPAQTTFIAAVFPTELDPIPVRIRATSTDFSLFPDQTAQLTVTATLPGGSTEDVTPRSAGTTYLSSNPNLLTVTEDGLVTGANSGRFNRSSTIAVLNEGNIAAIRITAFAPSNDNDNDGMPNDYEDLFGLNKFVDDRNGDLDNDGLTNIQEFNLGTIPNNPDTDGDTINDGVDNNPLHPEESPPTVEILSPTDGQNFTEGETIPFTVEATDDGLLTSVQLSTSTGFSQTFTQPPFATEIEVPGGVTQIVFTATAADSVNNIATQTATVSVIPDPLTTVIGTVIDPNNNPVANAPLSTNGDRTGTTAADGTFSIPDVPTIRGDIVVMASANVNGQTLSGRSLSVSPVAGGVTDVGTFSITEFSTLYSISRDDPLLRIVNSNDASTISGVLITVCVEGQDVRGGNGLATDPLTGELWALLRLQGRGRFRELVKINATTGVATKVGNTGDAFASLAFDSTGTLYGITGDGAEQSETLFTLDKSNAMPTFVVELGRGDDGEAIAFNPDDGRMYHASGLSDPIFESIDLQSLTTIDIPIPEPPLGDESLALTYWQQEGVFLWADNYFDPQELFRVTAAGVPTLVGELDHISKGLAFGRSPDGRGPEEPDPDELDF